MKNNIKKEEMLVLIKLLVFLLIVVGSWVILGSIIVCWNLPGFIDGIIGVIMLLGVPNLGVWVTNKIEEI